MPWSRSHQYEQQKLRQCVCVAGASVMPVGGVESFGGGNGEGEGFGGWNVGQRGCFEAEQGCRVVVARCQQLRRVVGAMWKGDMVVTMMKLKQKRVQEEWSLLIVDLIRNLICCSSSACSVDFQTGISCGGACTKEMSNADHQNTSDLVIERNMTDLCWFGNDVTVSCSVNHKYTNAGRELPRKAMREEAITDANSLQQNIRRSFIFIQIVGRRVGQDRRVSLYDLKFYSATSKKQVIDAQSLRLVEGCSAKCKIQSARCAPALATLFISRLQRFIVSVLYGIELEIDLDVVAQLSTPVDEVGCFYFNFGERGVCIQFVDLPRTHVALLDKVPQFENCIPICFSFLHLLALESPIWQLHEMEHSPAEC